MLAFVRPYVTRRRFFASLAVLIFAALILPFLSNYAPLRQQMAQRYHERETRLSDGERASQAARQKTSQEEAQRAAREDAERRLVRDHSVMVGEFRRILQAHREPVKQMEGNLIGAYRAMAKAASSPSFYSNGFLKPEETSSALACNDPASTTEMWNRDKRRDRNIYACTVYLALNPNAAPEANRFATMALLQRVNDDAENGYYPFQTVIAYIWLQYLAQTVNQGKDPGTFPALNEGEAYNPALFQKTLSPGFAKRLIETATTAEKLSLTRQVYPDLKRMADLGTRIASACQVMQRTTACLRAE